MAVMVQDDGVPILEYELKVGNSASSSASVERPRRSCSGSDPAPEDDLFLDADSSNVEQITVEFEHALSGPQTVSLSPGNRLTLNPVVSRRWVMSAKNWE